MKWTESLSVGVPELDDDHKGLIDIINRLSDQSASRGAEDLVAQSLTALKRYAELHFGREQRVMSLCGFPSLEAHIEEHHAFIDRIGEIARRFEDDPQGLADMVRDELGDFLQDWLKDHIMVEDMAYRASVEPKLAEARQAAKSFSAADIWWSG